jgi:hypothetical protein
VDVISQGRDPERGFRLPLSRRWRIVAGSAVVLVAAVALTVTGLRLTRGAGTSGAPGFMVCAKSAQGCTNKLIIVDGRAVHFAQQVRPSG